MGQGVHRCRFAVDSFDLQHSIPDRLFGILLQTQAFTKVVDLAKHVPS